MIFLLQYDRRAGKLVQMRSFADSERVRAEEARLQLELRLNRARMRHEVVLLQAENEAAIRRTHRRYFSKLRKSWLALRSQKRNSDLGRLPAR